jgi:hypothetical protein
MKTKKMSVAATIAVCVFAMPRAMPEAMADVDIDKAEAFSDAFEAASDAAERPGDAKMTCDQLGVELITIMSSGKLQSVAKQLGTPEEIIAPVARYQAGIEKTAAVIGALRLLGYLMNVVQVAAPGMAMSNLAQLVSVAETALWLQQNKQTAQMQSGVLAQLTVLTPILPELARASVVGELAEDRNCEFLKKLKEQAKEK